MAGKTAVEKQHQKRLRLLLQFDAEIMQVCRQSRQLSLGGLSEERLGDDNLVDRLAVVGVDEVGRGCLAGPVVAAAVHLPEIDRKSELAASLVRLNDSKLLSQGQREKLSACIKSCAVYAIAEASVAEIDEINILHASLLAMKRARQSLQLAPFAVLLVDGNKKIPGLSDRQITVVKGDSKSASIAAASIIAKVHRDELMRKLSESYPDYGWHENKGYGSEHHRMAIRDFGITEWHRRSFKIDL